MFTRLQLYTIIGCILVASGIFALYEFWPRFASRPSDSSKSASAIDADNTPGTKEGATATETRRVLMETPLPDSYFKLTAKSLTDIEQSAGSQKIDSTLEMEYAHQKTNDGIILTFYSMELKLYRDGAFVEDTLMTRDKFVQRAGDRKTESSFDELPPEQQEAMAGAFATNLIKIKLDADQNELGRQVLSDSGYATIAEGNVNTLRLMHGPYHHGTDHWQGTKRIPMIMGLILDCPLEYTKANGTGNEIGISGSLFKDEVDSPQADAAIKNVSCSISGKESFDETIGEYTSGEMTLQYKFQIFQKGVQAGTLEGKMELSLERVKTKGK